MGGGRHRIGQFSSTVTDGAWSGYCTGRGSGWQVVDDELAPGVVGPAQRADPDEMAGLGLAQPPAAGVFESVVVPAQRHVK